MDRSRAIGCTKVIKCWALEILLHIFPKCVILSDRQEIGAALKQRLCDKKSNCYNCTFTCYSHYKKSTNHFNDSVTKRQKMARIATPWYCFVIYCYQSVLETTTPLACLRIAQMKKSQQAEFYK